MTGAVALAIVLVIAVAGMSLAMQAQRPLQPPPRPARPSGSGATATRRLRERRPSPPPPPPPPPPPADPEPEWRGPELLRSGSKAQAKVIAVVDERTVGPVTRSRLVLALSEGGDEWEVTVRHAFQTQAARSQVKVGGMVPVRYNPEDRTKVVLDQGRDSDGSESDPD